MAYKRRGQTKASRKAYLEIPEQLRKTKKSSLSKKDPSILDQSSNASTSVRGEGSKVRFSKSEYNSIVNTKGNRKSGEDDEELESHGADEPYIHCMPLPFCNLLCGSGRQGVMKGAKRKIPRKLHIISHWKKQLKKKIDPMKHAVVVGGHPELSITYQELDEFSNAIAYSLKETKFSGEFVNENPSNELIIAVCHPPCYEYVVILIAILKLGAAILPLGYDMPPEGIANAIKLTRPVLTIYPTSEDELFSAVSEIVEFDKIRVDSLWELLYTRSAFNRGLKPFKDPIKSPDPSKPYPAMWKRTVAVSVVPSDTKDIQAFFYDSRTFLNRLEWEDHFFVFINSEHVLLPPTFDTIDSIAELLTPLCSGVTLVVLESPIDYFIPDQLLSYCDNYKLRRLTLWPTLLKTCLTAIQLFDGFLLKTASVKYWFCMGGFLRSELAEMFFETIQGLVQLIHVYQYEDCVGGLAFQIYETMASTKHKHFHSRIPVGFPIPNTEIYLLDKENHLVNDGQVGEICVAGLQLPLVVDLEEMRKNNSYIIQNPFSKKSDKQILLKTYDYGRIIRHRKGSRILVHEITKARHYYIENRTVWLLNVDMHLGRLENLVTSYHTFCYRANQDDQLLVSFCVFANSSVTEDKVEGELAEVMPSYLVPEVVKVDLIPKSPGTKTADANFLLKLYLDQRAQGLEFDNWKKTGLSTPYDIHAAKVLSHSIHSYLGIALRNVVEIWWNQPFLQMRQSTVAKGCFIVKELHENGFPVFTNDLIFSENMEAVVLKMVKARKERGCARRTNAPPDEIYFIKNRYKLEVLMNSSRILVCSLLAKCFTRRDQLDYYAEVSESEMKEYFDAVWPVFAAKKISLIIRNKQERHKLVGACLNMNWHDELHLKWNITSSGISYKLELMRYLESGLTDAHFPQEKSHVLQICYIGLDANHLSSYEIHGLTDKLIRSMLIIGKVKGFDAVVLTTFDFPTTDICLNNYGFKVAKQCQVNHFIASDTTRPYAHCPDSLNATLCWKLLSQVEETSFKTPTDQKLDWYQNWVRERKDDHKKPWSDKPKDKK